MYGGLYSFYVSLTITRIWRAIFEDSCRSAYVSLDRKPCFQLAKPQRSRPSEVRGPVLLPPCIRQRPLAIAGAWHGRSRRVTAPHRSAFLAVASACFHPGAWGPSSLFTITPCLELSRNDGLTALFDTDMLNCQLLLTAASELIERFGSVIESRHHSR